MNRLPLALALVAGLAAGWWALRSTPGPSLGPADGHDLAPVDTGRVGIGSRAPDFTLESRARTRVTLSELRGRRIVLVFYRGHW